MSTALVTGSSGFLGRRFVSELRNRGYGVVPLDLNTGLDCLDEFRLAPSSAPFDLVVHCAAREPHRVAIDGKPETGVYNQMIDAAMFDWAFRTEQRRVLYLSSCAVYPAHLQHQFDDGRRFAETDVRLGRQIFGAPSDDYGWTKLTGERMARAVNAVGVPTYVVRPFSGYGEEQSEDFPFGAFVARAKRREDPFTIWGGGTQVRDWIHVGDIVAGALAVVEADCREPVNLCTGTATDMETLAVMVCREAEYKPEFQFRADMPAGMPYRVGDVTRMSEFYTPKVTLEEGVRRAFA